MRRGEHLTLEHALRRVRRLGSLIRTQPKTSLAIPPAVLTLMLERSELWRWQLTEEGVLLVPVDEAETELVVQGGPRAMVPRLVYTGRVDSSLPAWTEPRLEPAEPTL